jgi:hypothetical protein
MSLARIAWTVVVLTCALACAISFAAGYSGYGWILMAVGLAAAVNLLPDRSDDAETARDAGS